LGVFLLLLPLAPEPVARAACIVDDTGTRVCVKEPPRRAVSLYGAFSELLAALGAAESLVARTRNDDTVPQVARLPSVGTGLRPDIEFLLALKPDLVVSRSGRAAGEALGGLRARGLNVAAFDPSTLEELYATVQRLGTLWERDAQAKALNERLRGEILRVRSRVSAVERRLRVVYEVRAEPLTVAGSDGIVDDLIRAAGGENLIKHPKKVVQFDPEALLRLDPDLYIVQIGPMNPKPRPPDQRATFRSLRAVRQGRVHFVEEDLFARPGPRVGAAAEGLSRVLYPELWEAAAGEPLSSTPVPRPPERKRP
jgi:iron complex transport system substrate-binding protein